MSSSVLNAFVWYPILERFRTKYYEVIVNLAKEIDMARNYLGRIDTLYYTN